MDLRESSLGFYRAWHCGLGARHGLFARLLRLQSPTELARATGLDENALSTWCRGCEALGILERKGARYRLHREHRETLGDPQDASYMGHHFAYLTQKSLHFGALDDLLAGKPASPDLSDVYSLATAWDHVAFFEKALPRMPTLLARLHEGIDVLDLGAGRGGWARACAARFPRSRITASDIDITKLEGAFRVARAADVPPGSFDLVFLGEVLAAACDPHQVIRDAYRALRPGGQLVAMEGLRPPDGRAARGWGEKLVLAMQLDFGLDGSRFLGRDEARSAIQDAGFKRITLRDLGGSLFLLSAKKG